MTAVHPIRRTATIAVALALGALALLLVAAPMPTRAGGTVHDVNISGFAFDPADLTIQAGDSVRWTNEDGADHTATATGASAGAFNSGTLGNGETFEFTFPDAGVFTYACSFHPSMVGTITVEAPAEPTAEPTQLPDGALPVPVAGDGVGTVFGALLAIAVLGIAGVAVADARRRS